ncbi:MAG: hypothetical protein FJZ56_02425 [Chlamydiae bacterium]|nr:hypothetical protein [Chlamydiota bacterium]
MIELQTSRKNKINLSDYNYEDDIKTRLMLASFTETDLEVLEEILYNPLEFPIEDLQQSLSVKESDLIPSLEKFEEIGLLERSQSLVVVNKDKRKYFELELEKFDEDFEPGMDFLQSLLKRVPIHVLPNWYHIPRHSNNIFESLIEKYLITPQVFQRYLVDLNTPGDPIPQIAQEVYSSEDLEICSETIKRKYKLSDEAFQETALLLEFNFLCCLAYRKTDDGWKQVIVPFQEWKDYLSFIQESLPSEQPSRLISSYRPDDYGFAKDLSEVLMHIDREPDHFIYKANNWLIDPKIAQFLIPEFPQNHGAQKLLGFSSYSERLLEQAILLGYAAKQGAHLALTESGFEWLEMGREEKAIAIFKHPFHKIRSNPIHSERNIHEIENSLGRLSKQGWVLLDEFLKGSAVALKEEKKVRLKKEGRRWRYSLPVYSVEERAYVEAALIGYLFESGIIRLGILGNDIVFRVTELGASLFEASS